MKSKPGKACLILNLTSEVELCCHFSQLDACSKFWLVLLLQLIDLDIPYIDVFQLGWKFGLGFVLNVADFSRQGNIRKCRGSKGISIMVVHAYVHCVYKYSITEDEIIENYFMANDKHVYVYNTQMRWMKRSASIIMMIGELTHLELAAVLLELEQVGRLHLLQLPQCASYLSAKNKPRDRAAETVCVITSAVLLEEMIKISKAKFLIK